VIDWLRIGASERFGWYPDTRRNQGQRGAGKESVLGGEDGGLDWTETDSLA